MHVCVNSWKYTQNTWTNMGAFLFIDYVSQKAVTNSCIFMTHEYIRSQFLIVISLAIFIIPYLYWYLFIGMKQNIIPDFVLRSKWYNPLIPCTPHKHGWFFSSPSGLLAILSLCPLGHHASHWAVKSVLFSCDFQGILFVFFNWLEKHRPITFHSDSSSLISGTNFQKYQWADLPFTE